MDLQQLIAKFLDEQGNIALPPHFTLPRLMELLYGAHVEAGGGDMVTLKDWDFSSDVDGVARQFTRTQVNTRIKAVAARLAQIGQPGDRVAVMAANSAEYLFGFIGAMYAGQVPIPLYDPNEPGHADHLRAVLDDAQAKTVVTNTAGAAAVRSYFAELPAAQRPRILAVDSLPDTLAESYQPIEPIADTADTAQDICFLQYTSGSTRNPAGVVITNESIVTDVIQIYEAIVLHMPMRAVSWLPLHHDMGIIVATVVLLLGQEIEIFSPRDFIQQPKRWIERMARRTGADADPADIHTYAAVPNFALDLSARYAAPEKPEDYDLTSIDGIICGSESVSRAGVDSFVEAFAPSGFNRTVLRPSYGLAETTLLVATDRTDERPKFIELDRDALAEGRAVETEGGVPMASNGQPVKWMHFALVDPETGAEVEDGRVGEIWVHGKNVAAGYLDRPEETKETFENTLTSAIQDGLPTDGWCATGDLGVQVDGHLYITGRVKDLVVVAGRNHYPQDIEATVMEASDHVRKDSVAAFAVPGDDVERLILMVERAEDADADGDAAAEDAIRAAVTAKHGISPDTIEFYAPNEIARSSAAKIARRINAKRFMEREA